MDPSIIEKLGKEEKYASQKDEYRIQLTPRTVSEIEGAEKKRFSPTRSSSSSLPTVGSCTIKSRARSTARTVEGRTTPLSI